MVVSYSSGEDIMPQEFWDKKTEKKRSAIMEICNSILTAFFLVMMVVYPLYVKGGYLEIGDVKYFFFRNVSLVSMGIMLFMVLCLVLLYGRSWSVVEHYRHLSVTDWFVYGYLIAVLLSYLFTAFRKEAFWGAAGWHMGLVSQILFVMFYFLFSRFFKWNNKMLYVILFSSGVVFILGILNRYSVYPIPMIGQTPTFISTLGNINWFCGYWAVICPLGILLYWKSRERIQRMAAGVYVVIAFLIGVVQGSGSAYLALAGLFLLLLGLSFRKNEYMRRLLELCILFAAACLTGRVLRHLPGLVINYERKPGILLTDTNASVYIGIAAVVLYVLFMMLEKKKGYQIAEHKIIGRMVFLIVVMALIGYFVVLAVNTCMPEGIFGLSGVSAFTFNDFWASSRGATWKSGFEAFGRMSPLHKLIGAGPDCFAEYVYSVPGLAETVYARFGDSRLTNAHNEWLTVLVNQGILGCVCYVGIFVSAAARFIKRAEIRADLYLCAAAVLVYAVHNMVSFQQILNTPFVFMLLGIGEGICREENF
ncbi:MAG: O-antigen ligase family protein [Roseburia sp.]|nr:O-antigen ligase family protein [Roseburia sp.]MCM1242667.1 O-antigen ligase family protein [Roseburia sp.]